MTDTRERVRSLDDPEIMVQTPGTIYDAIPPLTPRTEREAEFYQLDDGEMFLNLGPQHPSTHGVLRVVMKIDGERIVDIDPVLGYLHRGVEKICEHGDWHHAISNTDPLEYIASMFSESLPVLAAERLLDLLEVRDAANCLFRNFHLRHPCIRTARVIPQPTLMRPAKISYNYASSE